MVEKDQLVRSQKWTTTLLLTGYILGLAIIILLILIPILVRVYGPTFFPEANLDNIVDSVQTTGIILSFVSVAMSVFATWQGRSGAKILRKTAETLHEFRRDQEAHNREQKAYQQKQTAHTNQATPDDNWDESEVDTINK